MAEKLSMDSILGDNDPLPKDTPAETKVAEAPPEIKPETKDEPRVERTSNRKAWQDREMEARGRVRDPETGQYVAKEDKPAAEIKAETKPAETPAKESVKPAEAAKPAAAPQQEMTDKEKAFLRAMEEERKKRQELERRLQAIEAAKPKPEGSETVKTFWDDPEGALAKHQQEIRQETINARLQTAEFIARQKHPDFDEKVEVFADILKKTPGLHQEWLAAPDPAEFAYSTAKNHMEFQQAGSIEEMRAKIERETAARVRAEVEAELKAKAEALAKERAALPPSLSDARATGVNKPVWSGPTPMDDIIAP